MSVGLAIAILTRVLLVALFPPFSAPDKVLDFHGAVAQAREAAPSNGLATLLIVAGLTIEVAMSAAILTGLADHAAALVLAGGRRPRNPRWRTGCESPGGTRTALE